MSEEQDTCWICLSSDGDPLVQACNCPADRVVHKKCLARWQLQSAGKSEEHRCRFCQAVYPSWKDSLTPAHLKPAIPVVSVHYNGICYRLRVKPGPEGFASFQRQLQRITGLSVLDCMQITFQCRAPETAEELSFKGISAFDAAIHCAAISAAERLATSKKSSGDDSDTPTSSSSETGSRSSSDQNVSLPTATAARTHRVMSTSGSRSLRVRSTSRNPSSGSSAVPPIGDVRRASSLELSLPVPPNSLVDSSSLVANPPLRTDSSVLLEHSGSSQTVSELVSKSSSKLAKRLREMMRSLFL
ncbi:hypothetical protein CEUSTIGMA_g12502.t1 [Chlamydomonas eustigma]|uniref:RING-CH-type domain-containing protein n=1 Tax=Chlamydomonas eustigma TaxID=1157962 RepID=A0A250XQ73_9CHLO|nr:hypothetical protein CEUSTIGMA_g12502.t1 [Chlamydomonas eustigma]|eukprot:GAX85082.1 hypothetical protein CEUSTIGMA_g12502.t1 [Chlamydomonas eustigma]